MIMKTKIQSQHYTLLLSSFFFLLCSFFSSAQTYEWQWAKSGGGTNQYGGEQQGNLHYFNNELIWDITIDEDNNYYFLASLSKGNTHIDGNPVTDYLDQVLTNGASQVVIFSFTCEGTYRWSRPVGGGEAKAYKLTLDNNGGVYIMFSILNLATEDSGYAFHFSEDDVLPYWNGNFDEQDALKRIFLLKYDTEDGDLIWRKDIHGNVGGSNWFHNINHLQIDSNNVIHTVVGFKEGVHLDGQLTVPEPEENEVFKYYLLKFNHLTGALIGTPLFLPMGGTARDQLMSFRYDETLNRYYIAGWKPYGSGSGTEIFFNDITFGQQNSSTAYCFFISFNPNDLDDWWYKEITVSDEGINGSMISGIEIDSNSDIYITGNYFIINNESASFGSHTFSSTPYHGTRPFILKMNPEGEVQWSKVPDNQVSGGGTINSSIRPYDLTINGDEVAMATV